ncbi:hypothetical protein BTO02_06955 [Paraburkholderia sp. SOS3]|nr:hypothetical protein BTO02_06955 [Paraburkholderia sp. SOS3]
MLAILPIVDKDYYLARYPDVAEGRADAAAHFFTYGLWEGRTPNRFIEELPDRTRYLLCWLLKSSRLVDGDFYLNQNRDVAQSGLDPIDHYIRYGFRERRLPNRQLERCAKRLNSMRAVLRRGFLCQLDRRVLLRQLDRRVLFELAKGERYPTPRLYIAIRRLRRMAQIEGARVFLQCLPIADLSARRYDWVATRHIEGKTKFSFTTSEIIGDDEPRSVRIIELPEKWIAAVDDADVIGAFQVVANGHFVHYEPAAHPANDFVAGSWPYVTGVGGTNKVVVWYEYQNEQQIEQGILISGRCSPNYFHWLIEYLARIYIVDMVEALQNIPLIIDGGMYDQEIESIKAVCPDWPIHFVSRGTLLRVRKLYIPSIPTYLPDTLDVPSWQASVLCHKALAFVRNAIFCHYAIDQAAILPTRKIFLARRGARNLDNTEQIERRLASIGFEIVDTAELSFEQQVRLFASAAIIVGPVGAAFANLIFCNPACKVLGLTSPYVKRFTLQSQLAAFAECEYKILPGTHPDYVHGAEQGIKDVDLMHVSFNLDPELLLSSIEPWLNALSTSDTCLSSAVNKPIAAFPLRDQF